MDLFKFLLVIFKRKVQQKDSSLGQEISKIMNSGDLVPDEHCNKTIVEKISELKKKKCYF